MAETESMRVRGPFWVVAAGADKLAQDEGSRLAEVRADILTGGVEDLVYTPIYSSKGAAQAVIVGCGDARLRPLTFRTPGDFLNFLRDLEKQGRTHLAFDPANSVHLLPIAEVIAGITKGPLQGEG